MSNTAGLAGMNTSGQFLAVVMTGIRTVGPAGVSASVAGILQNDPSIGQAANIAFSGVTKAMAGGTVTAGQPLSTKADGTIITGTVGTTPVIGQAIEGAATGQVFTMLLSAPGSF